MPPRCRHTPFAFNARHVTFQGGAYARQTRRYATHAHTLPAYITDITSHYGRHRRHAAAVITDAWRHAVTPLPRAADWNSHITPRHIVILAGHY